MTDEQVSWLSALVDGELAHRSTLPLFDALERDPALRAAWERYHLIGQVLRGEHACRKVRGVAAAVQEQLRAEPTPMHPPGAAVRSRVWRTPFAGAALAAAAVLLAVLAVPSLYQGPETVPGRPQLLAAAPPPVSAPTATPQVRRWQTDRDDLVSKGEEMKKEGKK